MKITEKAENFKTLMIVKKQRSMWENMYLYATGFYITNTLQVMNNAPCIMISQKNGMLCKCLHKRVLEYFVHVKRFVQLYYISCLGIALEGCLSIIRISRPKQHYSEVIIFYIDYTKDYEANIALSKDA